MTEKRSDSPEFTWLTELQARMGPEYFQKGCEMIPVLPAWYADIMLQDFFGLHLPCGNSEC